MGRLLILAISLLVGAAQAQLIPVHAREQTGAESMKSTSQPHRGQTYPPIGNSGSAPGNTGTTGTSGQSGTSGAGAMPDYARLVGSTDSSGIYSAGGRSNEGSGTEKMQAELIKAQTKVLQQLAQKITDLDKRLKKLETDRR